MAAASSSGKHPYWSSVGIEGCSSNKFPLQSPRTSTTDTEPSRRASVKSRGPSSSNRPRSPNLPRGAVFFDSEFDSDSDNMNKQAPCRQKRKQHVGSEKGKEAAARGKGTPVVSSFVLAIPEMKHETQATFRFRKIVVTVRYTDDSHDETKAMFMTKNQLIEQAKELRIALKWRSKYVSDSDDSDA